MNASIVATGGRATRATMLTLATALAVTIGAGACGGCGSAVRRTTAAAPRPAALPLATSLAGSSATWAVVPMGATGPNLFWQLFVLPAHGIRWGLVTPPGVATNGAIALGAGDGQSLLAGIHPSQFLDFSPMTSTPDGGRTWRTGAPDGGLASVPDALAAPADGGQLIALDRDGDVEVSRAGPSGPTGWSKLTGSRAVAVSAAGRACGLRGLTAVAAGPAGAPVAAGLCARRGQTGIFGYEGGNWRAAGPALPASLRAQQLKVLRLTRTGGRLIALLQAGGGQAASLLTAWTTDGIHWTLSPLFRLGGESVVSSSFGDGGNGDSGGGAAAGGAVAVALSGQRGVFLAGPGASWQTLPELPPGHAVTLALPVGGGVDALATDGSMMTAWRLQPAKGAAPGTVAGGTWTRTQQTKVPLQYGSSS